jgi:hypothetical protein
MRPLEAPRVKHSETVGSVKAVPTQKREPLIVAVERFGQKDHFVSEHRKRLGDRLLAALRQVAPTILSPRQNIIADGIVRRQTVLDVELHVHRRFEADVSDQVRTIEPEAVRGWIEPRHRPDHVADFLVGRSRPTSFRSSLSEFD